LLVDKTVGKSNSTKHYQNGFGINFKQKAFIFSGLKRSPIAQAGNDSGN